ncbi:MAG TPA: cupin domain-containing protein [Thermoanaerobaculia bacterium]|nr:cupin domain-containing protein [Thermoanaerobaculia bacterium]
MQELRPGRLVLILLGTALLGAALAQERPSPPTENKGIKAPVLTSLDLGPEIEGMQGRQLRMRLMTIEPGGALAMHSHKDRPALAYLLHGTLTETREGGEVSEHKEGDSWAEGKTTKHWAENRGTVPAVAVVVDVFKQ